MHRLWPHTREGWAQVIFGTVAVCLLVFGLYQLDAQADRAPAIPQDFHVTGHAIVHDGDSLHIGKTKIRLWGIDAPELKQNCLINAEQSDCGVQARDALREIIGEQAIACAQKGISYDRVVAQCFAGDVDIAQALMQRGFAISEWYHSRAPYEVDEKAAKAKKLGIWQSTFEKPSQWRLCHLPRYEGKRPSRCGRYFHTAK